MPLRKNTVHQITATKKFEEFQEYVKLDDIKPLERFGLVWRRGVPSKPQLTRARAVVLQGGGHNNTVVSERESSTLIIKSAIRHDPEPLPSTSHIQDLYY